MCSSNKSSSSSDKLDQYTLEKSLLVDIEQWRSRVSLWQKGNRERERKRQEKETREREKKSVHLHYIINMWSLYNHQFQRNSVSGNNYNNEIQVYVSFSYTQYFHLHNSVSFFL